jgi:hypothetical protein
MDIEGETLQQILVSMVAVGLFVVVILVIGTTYGTPLGGTGGLALISAIVLFVLVMAGVGLFLSR